MVHWVTTDEEILQCRKVLQLLRPHLDSDTFLERVKRTLADRRSLICIKEGDVAVSAAVFECGYNLYRGSYIYIDDLTTLPEARGKGYAGRLLDRIFEYARENRIEQVHLDSAVNEGRADAHRLYLNKRFRITSLHFALSLSRK